MFGNEILMPEGEHKEQNPRLFLPKSLDEDIKRRLTIETIMQLVGSVQMSDEWRRLYEEALPERYATKWSMAEVNYLLYGKSAPEGVTCTGFYFLNYNFFHYINVDIPEEADQKDVCDVDRGIAPHTHSFLYNSDRNNNRGKKVIGSLHNHPHGLSFQKDQGTVSSVGFSGPDLEWNQRYIEKYSGDGRDMAFLIYYSKPSLDFYKGIKVSRTTEPQHLEIVVK